MLLVTVDICQRFVRLALLICFLATAVRVLTRKRDNRSARFAIYATCEWQERGDQIQAIGPRRSGCEQI
jgi:hypothetical protein